jgi:CelD/BcsL family acetyltransferase involved in cellulose biosynthesis
LTATSVQIETIRPFDKRGRRRAADGVTWTWEAIGAEWRALEVNAAGSFFQSWTWIGCQVERRFTNPLLLRATDAGRVVGLALFNQTGPRFARTLWLNETGRKADDSVFIEHNGPLLAQGHEFLMQPMLAVASSYGRLILSGVDAAAFAAAQRLYSGAAGCCSVNATQVAPYLDLTELHSEQDWLGTLGPSTRYRLRRSYRAYEAERSGGQLVARAAADVPEALRFLDALSALHQSSWIARGKRGAFAEPAFTTFHQALVTSAVPRGEVELLQVSLVEKSGCKKLGYLYNLRWQGKVYTYQSGFDYEAAGRHQLPGLTCHGLAIKNEIACGTRFYDFLAGESQYKRSFSNSNALMYWLTISNPGAAYHYIHRLNARFRTALRNRGAFLAKQLPTSEPHVSAPHNRSVVLIANSRAHTRRMAWPLAAACIAALSVLAWLALGYIAWHSFLG